jgi:hypothetical protein
LGPLITNSSPSLSHSIPPTRYHSLHFLVFSASALAYEERRSGFLVVLKRSDHLREVERSSGFRAANHPRSCRPASSRLLPTRIGFIAPLSTAPHSRRLPLSPRAGVGGRNPRGATVVRRERPQHRLPTAFTKHIFVGFCSHVCRPTYRPLLLLLPLFIFPLGYICGCVIIHVLTEFLFSRAPGE